MSRMRGRGVSGLAVASVLFSLLLGGCSQLSGERESADPASPSTTPSGPSPTGAATRRADVDQGTPDVTDERSGTPPATASGTFTPGSGNTVKAPTQRPLAAISLSDVADGWPDLAVRLAGIERLRLTPTLPGDPAGRGITMRVVVRNTGEADVELAGLAVALSYGRDRDQATLSASQTRELPSRVAAGETVRGNYVFGVPPRLGRIRVELTSTAFNSQLVFQGEPS